MYVNLVLFQGSDLSDNEGLWATDGTAAGTTHLSVAGAGSGGNAFVAGGLQPADLTVFGSEVLFNGTDAAGDGGLWVTNGTGAGTSHLTVAGANSAYGLQPNDLTVFGSEVLFNGLDAAGDAGLWVTNGTGAGTSHLTVAGAYGLGLDPISLTVFGSEVLFDGTENFGGTDEAEKSLWVTNGTGAGTSQLTVAGASADGLTPGFLTVFGNEVLFSGYDAAGHDDLWVTDGTGAGTSKLAVTSANFFGLAPTDMTVFGNEVLFNGKAASGDLGLWVTDGTGAGTSEVFVAGAYSGGLNPNDLTVFGNEVLFNGEDASGHENLWVTNGTSAGTSELNAFGLDPYALTVIGNEALFDGGIPGFQQPLGDQRHYCRHLRADGFFRIAYVRPGTEQHGTLFDQHTECGAARQHHRRPDHARHRGQ